MSFSAAQQKYIGAFAKESGLDPGVVSAWVASEEPVGATERVGASRVGAPQDWLNIGITESGPKGAGSVNWNDPVAAGTYGAKWLKGQVSIPGFGKAASGVQRIATTAGKTPAEQFAAIKSSGWDLNNYANTDFNALYNMYKGNAPALVGLANAKAGAASGTTAPATTVTTPPTIDWQKAGAAALMRGADKKINVSGKFTSSGVLSKLLGSVQSGAFTTPGTTTTTPATTNPALAKVADAKAAAPNATAQSGVAKILGLAKAAVGGPYSQAHHGDIFGKSAAWLKANGTDCSGFVSWLMGPDGLGIWSTALATPDIPSAPGIQKGAGSAITIWNNPLPGNSGHVFINIGGQFFQSAGGGTGIEPISAEHAQSMIANGDNGAKYYPLHPKGY